MLVTLNMQLLTDRTSPYDFQTSVNVINLAKENSIINQCGREGIVRKGDAEFYFILGDVIIGQVK